MQKKENYYTLLVDTREHRCEEFRRAVEGCPVEVIPATLTVGDYCLNVHKDSKWRYDTTKWGQETRRIFPDRCVERKWPDELIKCLIYDSGDHDKYRHLRFTEEMAKIKNAKTKMIIAIDGTLEEVKEISDDYGGYDYISELLDLIKQRYGIRIVCLGDMPGNGILDKVYKILMKMERS